jgi:tRNA(adenine34) deaminase
MQLALHQAALSAERGEVPVGAVLVKGEEVVAQAHNSPISTCDPSAHAEIQVLRAAGLALANYRLLDTTLYVTIEPCAMCLGAIMHARVARLVFGATEPRAGCVHSHPELLDKQIFNHRVEVTAGVLAEECGQLMQDFFKSRR